VLQGGGDAPALGRYCTSRPRSAHLQSSPTRTTFSQTCCISSSKSLRPEHPEGCPALTFSPRHYAGRREIALANLLRSTPKAAPILPAVARLTAASRSVLRCVVGETPALRANFLAADRATAERELAGLNARRSRLEDLQCDKESLLKEYAGMVPWTS
jgi:hypothetical protein